MISPVDRNDDFHEFMDYDTVSEAGMKEKDIDNIVNLCNQTLVSANEEVGKSYPLQDFGCLR